MPLTKRSDKKSHTWWSFTCITTFFASLLPFKVARCEKWFLTYATAQGSTHKIWDRSGKLGSNKLLSHSWFLCLQCWLLYPRWIFSVTLLVLLLCCCLRVSIDLRLTLNALWGGKIIQGNSSKKNLVYNPVSKHSHLINLSTHRQTGNLYTNSWVYL